MKKKEVKLHEFMYDKQLSVLTIVLHLIMIKQKNKTFKIHEKKITELKVLL